MAENEPWDAQSLQVVWFSPRSREVKAEAIYTALTGNEPDSVQTNKVPQPANPFLGIAQGSLDQATAMVQVQQTRVDFFMNPKPSDTIEIALIKDTNQHLDRIISNFQNSCNLVDEVLRCAIVLMLVRPVESLKDAGTLIKDAVGFDLSAEIFSDLNFSVNVQKSFKNQPNYRMNRLVRWSADAYQMINLQFGNQPVAFAPATSMVEQFGATHYIDINTVPVTRAIEAAVLAELIGEMGAEAKRLRNALGLKAMDS